ncbi:hypothetical protein C2E23DRAFT_906508 [Lenzites betulinus]|nr:hypothetical protein C2E23DRAFT_906508 [Lenzites betulinus]
MFENIALSNRTYQKTIRFLTSYYSCLYARYNLCYVLPSLGLTYLHSPQHTGLPGLARSDLSILHTYIQYIWYIYNLLGSRRQ